MDFPPNTDKQRELEARSEKKVEQVITTPVVIKEPGIGRKLKTIFFGGEFKSAGQFVVSDIILPTLRNMFVDSVSGAAQRVAWGDSMRNRNRRPEMRSRITYNAAPPQTQRPYSAILPNQAPRYPSVRPVNHREANDILIVSREEANLVLERLIDIVDKYEVASLADLYDLIGQPSSPIDNKWGWTYLNTAEIRQTRNGYLLELPPMEEL